MRRILVLLLVISGVLAGCGDKELSYSEVKLDDVDKSIQEFIMGITPGEDPESTGIYVFTEDESYRYVYIDEDFLDSGKGFGDFEVKTDEDSFQLHMNESDEPREDSYKLYKITLDRQYEYMKVYKNGEETYLQLVVGGA